MLNLAKIGGGIYSFIPDAKILGTNFVNCIANATTTLCLNAKVHLIPCGGSKFSGKIYGDYNYEETHGGKEIIVSLGNLQYGVTRNICVPMNINKDGDYLLV